MTSNETNPAHGGKLIDLVVSGNDAKGLREKAKTLRLVRLNSRTLSDLELLAVGGYSPLDGFMTRADYTSVVNDMHLAVGLSWSMPITLAVGAEEAASISEGDEIALGGEDGRVLATMQVREKFGYDKAVEAREGLPHDGREAPGRRGAVRAGRRAARRAGAGAGGAGPRRLPAVPADAGADARGVRGARLADDRRLPDAQPGPPRARVHPEVRAGDRRRPAAAPAGRRHEGRRHPGGRADAVLRGAARRTTTRRTACCSRCSRRRCATPARARRSSTRSCARTTAARTSSSGATTPASATTTARTTRS